MLAERENGKFIAPTWRNLKLGPILRQEKDIRSYGDLFCHRSTNKFFADLIEKLRHRDRVNEDSYLKDPRPSFVVVEGQRNHFADLNGASSFLLQSLKNITRNPPKVNAGGIAIHIRMGDFKTVDTDIYERNSRVSLSWFVEEAQRIRSILGNLPITIYTDDTGHDVAQAFKNTQKYEIASADSAINDILKMSSSNHIICSNSTFSLWAVFLSEATFSAKFRELFIDYSFDANIMDKRFITSELQKKEAL